MGRVLVSPKQGVYPNFDLAREMLHHGAIELHKTELFMDHFCTVL